MVTRRPRLAHDGQPLGVEPRQQNTALDLRTGHRQVVLDAAQLRRRNAQRREVAALPPDDLRTHAAQRSHDAAHRSAADLLCAGEKARKALPRQQARQQPHGCARIVAAQHAARLLQAVDAAPVDDQFSRRRLLDLDAQRAHDVDGRQAVRAVEKMLNARFALGQRGEHDGAVRDGFVAGNGAVAGEGVIGVDGDLGHFNGQWSTVDCQWSMGLIALLLIGFGGLDAGIDDAGEFTAVVG